MFPHLLGQKEAHKMSNDDMAKIIGRTRQTYENKIASGNFSIEECMAFSRYFNKPVDYLFMKESDIPSLDTPSPVNSITN